MEQENTLQKNSCIDLIGDKVLATLEVPRLPSSRGLSTGMLTFIYRLPSPEAIHGLQVHPG
jgi:hypothetical protein